MVKQKKHTGKIARRKVVLVTGANTGLGFQIVKAICGSEGSYGVLLGGRSIRKAEEAVKNLKEEFPQASIHPIQVDVEDDTSINSAFEYVKAKFGKLDALINNAGSQLDQQVLAGKMATREMWNKTGTSSLTTSENPDFFFNKGPSKGWPKTLTTVDVPAYRSSKTGMNMMMREWNRILGEDVIRVWAISPGYLATGLGLGSETNQKQGAIDPAIGAALVKDVLEGARDGDVGKVILKQGVQPW
ncbi:Ff.00g065590.m01.CDS01 [Fusarium sp. VM40]|nr:Ff.00g065590.m01.CDS01 [Fusarium sp. VM40]